VLKHEGRVDLGLERLYAGLPPLIGIEERRTRKRIDEALRTLLRRNRSRGLQH
jgi:hypothetical protein